VKPFEFEIIIDKNINREILLIPPLLIQPFVENAIWHGFKSLERKGKITIEIKKDQNKLLCTIDDNGVGRQFAKMESDLLQGKNKSFGIAITDDRVQRLKKLYNLDTGIEITDKINSFGNSLGTRIVLILPIIEKS
jgi:sensor histidine kinase YesM